MYINHVIHRYGRPTVLFDGYLNTPSTNDIIHTRKSGGSEVHFDVTMALQKKINSQNKQRFIEMLGSRLEAVDYDVHHDKGDGNVLVVEKAVACVEKDNTAAIADDTDILILLVHHAERAVYNFWFHPNIKKESKKDKKILQYGHKKMSS